MTDINKIDGDGQAVRTANRALSLGLGRQLTPDMQLAQLADVSIPNAPGEGDSLIYSTRNHKWHPGAPHANMPEWHNSTVYQRGDVVHFEGRIWRALSTATPNANKRPEIADGSALAFWKEATGRSHGPLPVELLTMGDPAVAPTTAPAIQVGAHVHLVWQSDTSYSLWSWEIDTATKTYAWKKAANTYLPAWRHVALPTPVTGLDTAQVWLYGMPGSTTPPAVPQAFWEPLALGQFLVSMADVNAAAATNGQVLTFDGTSKRWHPVTPADGYTKAEADTKIAAAAVKVRALSKSAYQALSSKDPQTIYLITP